MVTKPTNDYDGMTLVFSNPSRFDKTELLTGYVREKVRKMILLSSCELRTTRNNNAYLPNTRTVITFGQEALRDYYGDSYAILQEQRGSPFVNNGINYIPTFSPQDSTDFSNYEEKYNKDSVNYEDVSNTEIEAAEKSTKAKTQRKNWWFWFERDMRKAIRVHIQGGPEIYKKDKYKIYPGHSEIISTLSYVKEDVLYLDIETLPTCDLSCFGFSFLKQDVTYVVPVNNYDGELAYHKSYMAQIFRALAVAMRDNTVVAHNAMFDLSVLAMKYNIPWGRNIEDTMLMHHRCYPDVEKSLGHCLSLYTDLPYHKGEGVFEPMSYKQQDQLWLYNAKDVWSMKILHQKIIEHATRTGTLESCKQVNDSINPYLVISHTGIRYNKAELDNKVSEQEKRLDKILEIIEYLVGFPLNPNSPKQVAEYLYKAMGYKRPMSDVTNSKNLYKLLLKESKNIVIPLILHYRDVAKLKGMFSFKPWK